MKKLQTIIPSIILGLVIAIGATYAVAWTGPTGTPPNCPTGSPGCDAPINVSANGQTKTGALILGAAGASTTLRTVAGKAAFGTSAAIPTNVLALFGGTAGRIGAMEYCDQAGENCLDPEIVYNYVYNIGDDLVCPSTPQFNSANNVTTRPGAVAIAMPTSCKDVEQGCVVIQEYWNKKNGITKLASKTRNSYYQDPGDSGARTWSSTYRTGGTAKNGDNSTKQNIIRNQADGRIKLLDDYTGVEVTNSQWTAYDDSDSAGQKIFICTYEPAN